MGLQEVLQGVLDGLAIQLTGSDTPQPGALVGAKIVPPLGELDVTDVVEGDVSLTWLTKDVLFGNEELLGAPSVSAINSASTGGRPEVTDLGSLVALPGVPGLVGQLAGTLPLSSGATVPVQATITWQVLDEDGRTELPPSEYRIPGGANSPTVQVAFAPGTHELTGSGTIPAPRRRHLSATVTLTANGIPAGPRTLPPVPVLVPSLPIPTVLAMFLHTNFQARSGDDDGAVLVVVPASSPLRSVQQLTSTLSTLQGVIGNLTAFGSFAAFALGLSELVGALSAQPHVQFRAADSIGNLNDITLIQRSWYENDTEAEDELSSLILIGREGRGVRCSNARGQDDDEGQFTVRTGSSLLAIIRSLHSASPAAEGGTIVVDRAPPGGWWNPDQFGDELSSITFMS
ncbi:MAG TPA: hypothetical protein VNU01_07645 [Egibacteraceae bacterium]|nr:hypothetical protein [Egibacteraceae bacterium]